MAATYVLWDARGNEGPGGKGEGRGMGKERGEDGGIEQDREMDI